jgi:microcin C transport system permease protein
MIERLFHNEMTVKRWRRFKSLKRAHVSLWIFISILLLSVTAEFWSNNRPIVMSRGGQLYFPVLKDYHPTVFGQGGFVTDYRAIAMEGADWSVWPLIRWDPYESNLRVANFPAGPSADNWMGTDDRGRDVLSRLLYGFRYCIGYALLVWIFSFSLGIASGALMGYFGGAVDLFGQRVVEVFESLPTLLLLITLVLMFGAEMWLLVAFSTAFGWMLISIYMRGEFLRLRHREFVESARALGVGKLRMIFRHILPNSMAPVITFSPFAVAGSIAVLANLDYLGFGLPPPTPSWGELLQQAKKNFTIAWWLAVYPSLALFLTLSVLSLIGEGVRDAFDPRK